MRIQTTICIVFAAALVALAALPTRAAVTGPCVDCHTMHNSQDGVAMGSSTDPEGHLTKDGCIGCHTSGGVGGAPVIDGSYNVDSCAGGTFNETDLVSDAGVHNVDIVLATLGEDNTFTDSVPGLTGGMNSGLGSPDPNDLTCAGKNGCHGDATGADNDAGIAGFHHGSKEGYRYLQIASTQTAVLGKGADDWEAAISASGTGVGGQHNIYSSSTTAGINMLCANCHANFHSTANTQDGGGNNWIRHPTDNDIPATWTPTVNYRENPFAFADISSLEPDGTYDATNAQVACISCHRAHGTPYDDILRWDYSAQNAGSTTVTSGCLGCHDKQRGN